jgi:hypothetical protein
MLSCRVWMANGVWIPVNEVAGGAGLAARWRVKSGAGADGGGGSSLFSFGDRLPW